MRSVIRGGSRAALALGAGSVLALSACTAPPAKPDTKPDQARTEPVDPERPPEPAGSHVPAEEPRKRESLSLVSTFPGDGARAVPRTVVPSASFDRPLDPASVTPETAQLLEMETRRPLGAKATVDAAEPSRLVFVLPSPLRPGTSYLISLGGLRSTDGTASAPEESTFTTWRDSPPGIEQALECLGATRCFAHESSSWCCPRCGQVHGPRSGVATTAEGPGGAMPGESPSSPGPPPRVEPNGDLTAQQPLFTWQGRVAQHALHLSYRAHSEGRGIFGEGWRLNLDTAFLPAPNGDLDHLTADGREFPYRLQFGRWEGPAYFHHVVTAIDRGETLVQRLPDGTRHLFTRFQDGHRLTSVHDTHGNVLTVRRDPTGRKITAIVDELGRTVAFDYHAAPLANQVRAVRTWDGRDWYFEYAATPANVLLRSVATPPVDWCDEQGNVLRGRRKVTTYAYDAGRLASITNARGHVSWSAKLEPSTGRVLESRLGRRTLTFAYDVGGSDRTDVRDSIGTTTRIDVDPHGRPVRGLVRGADGLTRRTGVRYNAAGEVVEVVRPRGNLVRRIRDARGNVIQEIEVPVPGSNDPDLITSRWFEPHFNQVKLVIEPRGNHPAVVSFPNGADEDPVNGKPRTISVVDADARDAHTVHFVYEYETAAPGLFRKPFPPSFGRPAGYPSASVFRDLDGDGLIDRGSLLVGTRWQRPRVVDAARPAGFLPDRQVIETFATWNGWGQQVVALDAAGVVTRHEYYPEPWSARTAPNAGYRSRTIVDSSIGPDGVDPASGRPVRQETGRTIALRTRWTYSPWGVPTSIVDARGSEHRFEVDALGCVVRRTAPAPFAYEERSFYDGNNNLVRFEKANVVARDRNGDGIQSGAVEQTVVAAKPVFVQRWRFTPDDLIAEEVLDQGTPSDPGRTATTRFTHDDDLRLESITRPEGNVVRYAYDGLGRISEEVSGAGSARPERWRFEHDANGNLIGVANGLGHYVRRHVIDGHDRVRETHDELGGREVLERDAAGHVTRRAYHGSHPSVATVVLLEQSWFSYDELGRRFQEDRDHFLPGARPASLAGGTVTGPVGRGARSGVVGSLSTTVTVYDERSNPVTIIDPLGAGSRLSFDAAGRLWRCQAPNGSSRTFVHDKASNVVRDVTIEVADTGSGDDRTFYVERFFDELNRLVARVSPGKNAERYLYDSRGNVVELSDSASESADVKLSSLPGAAEHGFFPQGDSGVTRRGNTTRIEYDGGSRPTRVVHDLRERGVGEGAVLRQIELRRRYDLNGRLIGESDGRGAETTHELDATDRVTRTTFADGTRETFHYDAAGNRVVRIDRRGVRSLTTFDALERPVEVRYVGLPVLDGQGTFNRWSYDGRSNVVRGETNGSLVERVYTSLGRLHEEVQSPLHGLPGAAGARRRVGYRHDGKGRVTAITYPRTLGPEYLVERTHDDLDRVKTIYERTTTGPKLVASYDYVGATARRLRRVQHSAVPVELRRTYDLDRRVTRHDVRASGGTRVAGFAYSWTHAGQRRSERSLVESSDPAERRGRGDVCFYDSLGRLTRHHSDADGAALDAVERDPDASVAAIAGGFVRGWTLDDADNWIEETSGSAVSTFVQERGLPRRDSEVNQYTVARGRRREHDAAGNVTADGPARFAWDAADRIVRRHDGDGDTRYRYDAFGRRVSKRSASVPQRFAEIVFYYDGWSVLEEARRGEAGFLRRFVNGPELDEPLCVDQTDFGGRPGSPLRLWFHANSLGSIVALTDDRARVVERYRYEPYGARTVLSATGVTLAASACANVIGFTGRRLELEEGGTLYHYRHRTYDPSVGRFLARDPLAFSLTGTRGNAQAYCANDPINRRDPLGLSDVVDPGFVQGLLDGMAEAASEMGDALEVIRDILSGDYEWPSWDKIKDNLDEVLKEALLAALGEVMCKFPLVAVGILLKDLLIAGWDAYWSDCPLYTLGKGAGKAVVNGLISALGGKLIGKTLKKFLEKLGFEPKCFAAGTLVLTPEGLVPIEDLKAGDLVLAQDECSGSTSPRAVIDAGVRGASRLCVVSVARAADDVRGRAAPRERRSAPKDLAEPVAPDGPPPGRIVCTPEHPFHVAGAGWVAAGELVPGQTLQDEHGNACVVAGVELLDRSLPVHYLVVADAHTYFVAAARGPAVWVHNGCGGPGRGGAFRQGKKDADIPRGQQPDAVRRVPMTDRNGRAILGDDGRPIMTREYEFTRQDGSRVVIQDHSAGHQFGEGGVGDQGPHFNVRPAENTRTGSVPGTQEHYPFNR